MMRRAAAPVIPASTDDDDDTDDSVPDSDSSTSVTSPQPRRKQQTPHSILQVVLAAAAPPVAVEEKEEMTSQVVAAEGSASSEVTGTAINRYLRTYGRIPLTPTEVPDDVDLNVLAPPDASQQPPPRRRRVVHRPVICAYCNCAFCFGADEVPALDPGPGHVYPAPPEPITLDLLTPPAVGPLYRRNPWGPRAISECLLVCSSKHHFRLTMGMLQQQQQQQPGGAPPSLVWKCTGKCTGGCLNVLPVAVGSEGSDSPHLRANPPPPLEPWRYAGAYWNFVLPEHENMVKLKLHDDPLQLTL